MKKRNKKSALESEIPPVPGNRIYWNKDTENSIVKYNNSTDPDERNLIYRRHLEYPLNKMAENVINTFKFPYINYTFEDLRRQVVSHIICNIHKYTSDKGKAFSYFSVIAKNYLVLHNNTAYKEEKRSIPISELIETDSLSTLEEWSRIETPDEEVQKDTTEFVRLMLEYWDKNLHRVFKKPRDQKIANAILLLFRRADGIENFNKKNIYLLIREQTDCKTNYITKIVNRMKLIIMEQLKEYHRVGTIAEEENKYFKYN